MDLPNLYDKIRKSLAHVLVLENREKISEGSGFCFLPTGEVITAAHTIAGGFPVRDQELHNPNRLIIVRLFYQNKSLVYKPILCPIELRFSRPGVKPFQIDIAVIGPKTSQKGAFDHLLASVAEPPKLGEELYFAGYSDEVEFPFDADRHFDPKTIGLDDFRREFDFGIRSLVAGPMIKRGVVGNAIIFGTQSATVLGTQLKIPELRVTAFYLDNQIHDGASGGPIVAQDGIAKGIITKRAMTTSVDSVGSAIRVPSGSTMGISLEILKALPSNSIPSK